jgi:RNA polymerase sigma-70 factor (ECF subfamily)
MSVSRPQLVSDDRAASPEAVRAVVDELFRENYAGLCRFVAQYVGTRATAEDVVQEMFLRLWERIESGQLSVTGDRDDQATVTTAYLYAAARSHAISVVRHQHVERRYEERQVLAFEQSDRTVHDDAVESEITRAVRRAVAALPSRSRVVFSLSRESGLTHPEIAEVLGISVKGVEANMTRALKALRSALSGVLVGSVILSLQSFIGR